MEASIWSGLLHLSKAIRQYEGTLHFCAFRPGQPPQILINEAPDSAQSAAWVLVVFGDQISAFNTEATVLHLKDFLQIERIRQGHFDDWQIRQIKNYLPYCFIPIWGRQKKRALSIAHFAQSLDGKIATQHGNSRWIGNDANLDHAHRMRALCDAVLVGSKTVEADAPRLTVRRVEGDNPVRVVLGTSVQDFSSLHQSAPDPILVFGTAASFEVEQADYHRLPSQSGRFTCDEVLQALHQKGIHSVYVEGGAHTTSGFLKEGAIDILQFHIAPLVFGSGKSAITLPEIEEVDQAIQFSDYRFQKIDDTVMFVGQFQTLGEK